VQVARFAGGGMLGALLYQPISFLFSNIGSFMIGVLIILLGAFILSPWDVLDIMEYAKEAWQKGAEKRLERTAQRQEKKAERQAQKEREAKERAEAERLADLTVDEETGEILDDVAEALPQETEIFAPEPEISDYASEDYYDNLPPEDYEDFQEDYGPYPEDVPSEEFPPSMVVEGDDAPVEVDFTPKELLQYKLPQIDLFAPDKPKSQSKERHLFLENLWLVSKCLTQRLRRFLSENYGNSPRRTLISSWKFLSVRQLMVRLVALIWVGCLTCWWPDQQVLVNRLR